MRKSELPHRPYSWNEPIERVFWWEIGNILQEYFGDMATALAFLTDSSRVVTLAIEREDDTQSVCESMKNIFSGERSLISWAHVI